MHIYPSNEIFANEHQQAAIGMTRRLIWLYCILWLIEGALRKWVLPGLSMQLLLIRDPVALAIYYYASRARVFPSNGWLGFLGILTAVIAVQAFIHFAIGSVSWAVALFGVRTFILHVPLIWVIPAVFGRKEITLLGKWALALSLPLALLMVVQFEVGPDHWLNAATIKGGAQIGSVSGRIRPPAIFSFVTGPIHFYVLTAALAIAGFVAKDLFPRWLAALGLGATLIAMSVAASRGMVLGCALVAAFGVFAAFRSGRAMSAGVALGIVLLVGGIFLSRFETIQAGVAAFQERWSSEDDSTYTGHRVMTKRFGDGFISAFEWAGRVSVLGVGVGSTSNLAAEKKEFMSPVEGEWERVIYEVGPITGFLFLGFRAALSFSIMMAGLRALRAGNYVCLLLGAACFNDVLTANIRQPTTFGYVAVCAGLCLASIKAYSTEKISGHIRILETESVLAERPRMRGRGRFSVGGNPVRP